MKADNFCKENRPEAKKKLRLPGNGILRGRMAGHDAGLRPA